MCSLTSRILQAKEQVTAAEDQPGDDQDPAAVTDHAQHVAEEVAKAANPKDEQKNAPKKKNGSKKVVQQKNARENKVAAAAALDAQVSTPWNYILGAPIDRAHVGLSSTAHPRCRCARASRRGTSS